MTRSSHLGYPRRTRASSSFPCDGIEHPFCLGGGGMLFFEPMPDFRFVAPFQPTGDQPQAIDKLVDGLGRGLRHQTLLGATGTGKTATLAWTIEKINRPTLVLAHNKTLAAQLYAEFREFFPDNAVEYFVSYFDYYQPEAYLPRSDTYIEKDSSRNDEIDRLRHAATHALFERGDVIIVASVSCIYGLGAPVDYGATVVRLRQGGSYRRDSVLRQLVDLQYQRNDQALQRARFRVRGDTLEFQPASEETLVRVEFFGDEVERITELDPLTGELLAERKEINVYFGFRLPSALDNRPLTFEEFEGHLNQVVHMSATPGPYEHERSERIVEQLVRPTGIVDPMIDVRPTDGQIDDLLEEIRQRVERGERALVTTLTKKLAEDLSDYLHELGVKVQYLHSEVDTLERVAILRDLRLGIYDVLVGINLLREGIDLPEVTLVAIIDADKEGFLRSSWSLIQMIGRAARNIGGKVVMYADTTTESMAAAIEETNRRRSIQDAYNREHGIEPTTIVKEIHDLNERLRTVAESTPMYTSEREELAGRALSLDNTAAIEKLVARMETEMRAAAKQLDFERAAALRDEVQNIRLRVPEQDASLIVGRAAERAASSRGAGLVGAADRKRSARASEAAAEGPAFEVTSVTVLPAEE